MNKLEFPVRSERLAPDGLYLARGAGETSPCALQKTQSDHAPIS